MWCVCGGVCVCVCVLMDNTPISTAASATSAAADAAPASGLGEERLQAATLYFVAKVANAQAHRNGWTVDPVALAALSDCFYQFVAESGRDLELFAHHDKQRATVQPKDVLLLARRNATLRDHLVQFLQQESANPSAPAPTSTSMPTSTPLSAAAAATPDHGMTAHLSTDLPFED